MNVLVFDAFVFGNYESCADSERFLVAKDLYDHDDLRGRTQALKKNLQEPRDLNSYGHNDFKVSE